MLSGEMSKFQQWRHICECGFMCLLFAGLCVLGGGVCVAGLTGAGDNPVAFVLFGAPFAAFAVWAIVGLVRGLKMLVREFSFDGRVLRFRTIASSQEQVRELHEIAEVRRPESGGRGPPIGDCVAFRGGTRVWLPYELQNGWMLFEQLRFQLEQVQHSPD